jgi:hypothetical protein
MWRLVALWKEVQRYSGAICYPHLQDRRLSLEEKLVSIRDRVRQGQGEE